MYMCVGGGWVECSVCRYVVGCMCVWGGWVYVYGNWLSMCL